MTTVADTLRGKRLPALDGLRAVAVGLVILGHFGMPAKADLGVSAFFVLSGFLITWLLLAEQERTGTVSLRGFYLRRSLRIFPAYYVFLAFSFVLDTIRHDDRIKPAIGPALAYLTNYYNALNGHPTNSIAHAWSLAVEEQFYLLWPLLFLVVAPWGTRRLMQVLAIVAGSVMVWRIVGYSFLGLGSAYVYNAFDTRIDNLLIGCLLAVVLSTKRGVSWAGVVAASPLLPLVTIGVLYASRSWTPPDYHYGPGFTINALLVAILITQLLQVHRSPLWAWLEHPITRYLGTISYPLYLYHSWGLSIGHRAPGPWPVEVMAGVAASVLLASGSYFVVERPFLRLKERLEAGRRRARVEASAVAERRAG